MCVLPRKPKVHIYRQAPTAQELEANRLSQDTRPGEAWVAMDMDGEIDVVTMH